MCFRSWIWFSFVDFLGIIKNNIMICFIIQEPISISKSAKLNRHLVTVMRNWSVGGSILHTESLVGFMLEAQTEVHVIDISKLYCLPHIFTPQFPHPFHFNYPAFPVWKSILWI